MNYKRYITLVFVFIFHIHGYSQYSEAIVIDNTIGSAGVSKIVCADLNQNGNQEIIASFTGTNGRIGYYNNLGNGNFSTLQVIDAFPACRGISLGDFNNDGWMDIVAIGGSSFQYKIYYNNSGTFTFGGIIDSDLLTQPNDVVVADFDGNNSDDIVAICQHSIDFYRNNSDGSFTKEEILTTSSSPKVLECLDIEINDVDGDDDIDLICGETTGLVVYFNNGNGLFSPQYYSIITEIISIIHLVDIDNDGVLDIITRNSAGDVKWFSNQGNGIMNYEATFNSIEPGLIAINSIDFNNDGFVDIFASYNGHVSVFLNNANQTFETEVQLVSNNSFPMGQLSTANLDNQNQTDLIWSGGTNTIAIHLSQESPLINTHFKIEETFIYPNPAINTLFTKTYVEFAILYSNAGFAIATFNNTNQFDIKSLPSGIYYLSIVNSSMKSLMNHKIVKQ